MTTTTAKARIVGLLDRLKADFPRRKKQREDLLKSLGSNVVVELHLEPPLECQSIATFDKSQSKLLSPMLEARFAYCGTWDEGGDLWLGPNDISAWISKKPVRQMHRSLREYWDGSAPMKFHDNDLSLLGASRGTNDSLVYLVWNNKTEPEIWCYSGMNCDRFRDLAKYLEWELES
jgi:hypothetical protein